MTCFLFSSSSQSYSMEGSGGKKARDRSLYGCRLKWKGENYWEGGCWGGQVIYCFGHWPLSQLPLLTVFATGIFSGFPESLVSFHGAGAAWNNIRFLYPALRLVSVCVPLSAACGSVLGAQSCAKNYSLNAVVLPLTENMDFIIIFCSPFSFVEQSSTSLRWC